MIFDFYPWQLDVDVEKTRELYKKTDYSIDKAANVEFIKGLSAEQLNFFNSLGVDLAKIEVDKTIYEIPEDEETHASKKYRMFINFLIEGKILALPKYQKDIYSDEEMFGNEFPELIKVSPDHEEYLEIFHNGIGAGIIFKHPCFHYDDDKFKNWDCGYILGTILIMQDIK